MTNDFASCEKEYDRLVKWVAEDGSNRFFEITYTLKEDGTALCYATSYISRETTEEGYERRYFAFEAGAGSTMGEAIKSLSKQIKLKRNTK